MLIAEKIFCGCFLLRRILLWMIFFLRSALLWILFFAEKHSFVDVFSCWEALGLDIIFAEKYSLVEFFCWEAFLFIVYWEVLCCVFCRNRFGWWEVFSWNIIWILKQAMQNITDRLGMLVSHHSGHFFCKKNVAKTADYTGGLKFDNFRFVITLSWVHHFFWKTSSIQDLIWWHRIRDENRNHHKNIILPGLFW